MQPMATSPRWKRLALALSLLLSSAASISAMSAPQEYRIYVTNEASGDLTVIDGTTNRVVATWPLGKRPRGIVAAPDGRTLYVALSGSPLAGPGVDESQLPPADKTADGIGVVQVDTGHVARVLSGVSDPEQLAISGDASTLFVASEDTGQAIETRAGDGKVLARMPVGAQPEGIAVSARAGLIAVTSEADNIVTLLDIHDGHLLKTIHVGERPRDAEFSPDGAKLFVSGENDASVTAIDTATRLPISTVHLSADARPKGIAVAPDGKRIYVSTGRGGEVVALATADMQVLSRVHVGQRPWGIALSADGRRLYTANGPSNDVTVVDTEHMVVLATIAAGMRPWGVAVSPVPAP